MPLNLKLGPQLLLELRFFANQVAQECGHTDLKVGDKVAELRRVPGSDCSKETKPCELQ